MVEYEYDAWGNITDIIDTSGINLGNINPYCYRSYYYDTETGMYYLNDRYYVPEWSRFLNADGIIGANQDMLGYNLYAYVSNNPINFSDPGGTFAIAVSTFVKGVIAVIGVAATYYAATAAAEVLVPVGADFLRNPYYNMPKFEYKIQDKTKTDTKFKPIVPYIPKNPTNKPCTTATLGGGDVVRGKRLTVIESIGYVTIGGNVMCDNQSSALLVAVAFPGFIGPEIDVNQKPGNTYYPHYHPDRNSHRHIWFYPTP